MGKLSKGTLLCCLLAAASLYHQWDSPGRMLSAAPFVFKQPFNQTNPNWDWCPQAECHNSPLCSPCNRRYLFILATGRSGSTTLQIMFEKLPGVRLSGENWGVMNIAATMMEALQQGKPEDELFVDDKSVEWGSFKHNAIPKGAMACAHQNLANTLNPPERWILEQSLKYDSLTEEDGNTILGFKEVRTEREGSWTAKEAAAYYQEMFPCSRYLINIRSDTEKQVQSMESEFEFENGKSVKSFVEDGTNFHRELAEELGDAARLTDLEEWKNNVDVLNEVIEWLGFKNCRFNTILHENHDGYQPDRERHLNLDDDCEYSP